MNIKRMTGISTLIAAATLASGCLGGAEEPTVGAASAVGQVADMAFVLDAIGPKGAVKQGGFGLPAALACDASPTIIEGSVCGHEGPVEAHFSWTDCAIEAPEGRGPNGPVSGHLDVTRAAEDGCGAVAGSAALTVERTLPNGYRMTLEATVDSVSLHDGMDDAASFTRTASLSVQRTLRDGATVLRSMSLSGELTIDVSREGDAPSRTMNGALTASFGEGQAAMTLHDVVRVAPETCFWPIQGTMTRAAGGATHTLVFGPSCGEGTLDGEVVDLASLAAQGRGRHGRGM